MSNHLVMFYGRTGSTLLNNHITQNICSPPFESWRHDIYSSEIHPNEYAHFLDSMKSMKMQWCMKYHVSTGVKVLDDDKVFSTIDRMKNGDCMLNRDYTFDLSGTDRFLSELNVTDLHFSFRIDTVDTICSHMIAEAHDTWIVNYNEIKEHAKLNLEPNAVRQMCIGSDMIYSIYNEYVKRYKDRYNCVFYPYENLHEIIDTENDYTGIKKQLSKQQKQELITNYDEVEEIIKEYFFYGNINEKTGILET